MIVLTCNNCGQKISTPVKYAGKQIRCGNCQQPLTVPSSESQAPPPKQEIIKFHCPHCNQKIGLAKSYCGKVVACAKCRNKLRVPTPTNQPAQLSVEKTTPPHPLLDFPPEKQEAKIQDDSPEEMVRCPRCDRYNMPNSYFCAGCGEEIPDYESLPDSSDAATFFKALGVSIGFTLTGVGVWVIAAYATGVFWASWIHFMAVGVAVLAGYGMTFFNNRLTSSTGALAIFIGLVGIILAKLLVAQWIVLPHIDSSWKNMNFFSETEITDEMVNAAVKDPNQTFTYACYHLAEEFGWD
jgi:DNA-directed RNA polymerase subunit RPC12/RpoP